MKSLKFFSAIFSSSTSKIAARRKEQKTDMSLVDHIIELRGHAFRSILWVGAFVVLAFVFMDELLAFLRKPFEDYQLAHGNAESQLMTTGVFEVVTLNFKIALISALVLSVPFIIRELWKFVSPALYDHERRIAVPIVIASVLMFYLGVTFGFYVIIPSFLSNTLEWASKYAEVRLTVDNYFSSISMMALLFGIIFEVPVFLSLLGLAGVVQSSMIAKNRRIVFLCSFIVGAILSPPDIFSQTIVSVPLYLMCELSVVSLKLIEKSREQRLKEET